MEIFHAFLLNVKLAAVQLYTCLFTLYFIASSHKEIIV